MKLCTNIFLFTSTALCTKSKYIQLLRSPNGFNPFEFDGTFPWEDGPYSGLELVTATESGKQHVESVSTSV